MTYPISPEPPCKPSGRRNLEKPDLSSGRLRGVRFADTMNPNPDPEILRIPYSGGVFEIRAEHAEAFFKAFADTLLERLGPPTQDFKMEPSRETKP